MQPCDPAKPEWSVLQAVLDPAWPADAWWGADNNLGGSLPPSLAVLPRLHHLNLPDNSFTSSIPPAWFAELTTLEDFVVVSQALQPAHGFIITVY